MISRRIQMLTDPFGLPTPSAPRRVSPGSTGLCGLLNRRFVDVQAVKSGELLVLLWRDLTEYDRHAAIV